MLTKIPFISNLGIIYKWLSVLALLLFFSFPIFPNAVGSIALGVFLFFFLINHPRWRPFENFTYGYLFIGSFYIFIVVSMTWSSKIIRGLIELKVGSAFIIITFIFWNYKVFYNSKIIYLLKVIFICSVITYFFIWADYHIEGVSLFQINHLKQTPLNSYPYFESITKLLKMKYSYFGYISEWGYFRFGIMPELFTHYSYISFAIMIALIFSTQILFQVRNIILKNVWFIVLIGMIFFLFQLPSKINLAIFVVFIIYIGLIKFPFKYCLVSLIAITFFSFYHFNLGEKFAQIELIQKEPNRQDNVTIIDFQRYQIYVTAIRIFKSAPIFGIGVGDVESKHNLHVIRNSSYEGLIPINNIVLNTHPQFAFFALSTGIVGLSLFCLFILYNIYIGIKYKNYDFVFFYANVFR